LEYAECPVSIPVSGMIYWRIDVRSDSLTFVATACSRRRYKGIENGTQKHSEFWAWIFGI